MSTNLVENSIFASRYRVIRCIAAGGMGAVYEVIHIETERKRALKVMHAHFVQSAELRDRFKSEARVAAKIDSDYIVDVFDAGIDEATEMPFLVMELLKGEELGKRLERQGKFSPLDSINYLWQTALALDKTHKANIVHRDLKPENLFLNQRDDGPPRVKVLDFGVAKFVAETGTQANVTRSVGTPLYMAPEQFLGQNVSPASDNYALAMMAYTLLVGEAYWTHEANDAATVFAFATQVQSGPSEAPSARAGRRGIALTVDFDRWFSKATSPRPAERYQSATATISALGQILGIDPGRLVGVAASDPLGPNPGARHSGTELITPGGSSFGNSGAVPGLTHATNSSGGVVTPVRPKSRAGTFAAFGVGGLVVVGIAAAALAMRGGSTASASSATPAAETARAASVAPTVAPAEAKPAPNVAVAATAEPAPSAAPSAEASAAETAPEPSAKSVAAGRGPARSVGKAPAAAGKPAVAAPPVAPPPAAPQPAAKQPAYTRD